MKDDIPMAEGKLRLCQLSRPELWDMVSRKLREIPARLLPEVLAACPEKTDILGPFMLEQNDRMLHLSLPTIIANAQGEKLRDDAWLELERRLLAPGHFEISAATKLKLLKAVIMSEVEDALFFVRAVSLYTETRPPPGEQGEVFRALDIERSPGKAMLLAEWLLETDQPSALALSRVVDSNLPARDRAAKRLLEIEFSDDQVGQGENTVYRRLSRYMLAGGEHASSVAGKLIEDERFLGSVVSARLAEYSIKAAEKILEKASRRKDKHPTKNTLVELEQVVVHSTAYGELAFSELMKQKSEESLLRLADNAPDRYLPQIGEALIGLGVRPHVLKQKCRLMLALGETALGYTGGDEFTLQEILHALRHSRG